MIRGVLLPIITPFDEKVRVDEQMMRQFGRLSHQGRRAGVVRARLDRPRTGHDHLKSASKRRPSRSIKPSRGCL